MIVLSSMFRDSFDYVGRYFEQIAALRQITDARLVLAEGDSTDSTYAEVEACLSPGDALLKIDHGGRSYGSIDHGQRWDDIAIVARGICDALKEPLREADAFVWIESDLIWTPAAIGVLLDDLASVAAVAPMVFAGQSVRFYDTWGYRKGGVRFTAESPHHPHIEPGLTPIDSCGSCFALAPSAFPTLFEWTGHWPFRAGGELHLDPRVAVRHP